MCGLEVATRLTQVYTSVGCFYDADRPNTVQLGCKAMFVNFLRLILILADSLVFVGVDEKTVDELREGLSSRINDHRESKIVKRMSRQYKIVPLCYHPFSLSATSTS